MLGIPSADQIAAMEQKASEYLADLERATNADAQALVAKILAAAQSLESQTAHDVAVDLVDLQQVIAEVAALRKVIADVGKILERWGGATVQVSLAPPQTS
jgi:KaiC/GvpD/RAD55 family RecA-like ATPase